MVAENGFTKMTCHFSIPKSFASGDASEWFKRFDICSAANKWNEVAKLPTLLEGEAALATWLELSEHEQKDYNVVKKKIIESLMPTEFVTLAQFQYYLESLCQCSFMSTESYLCILCRCHRVYGPAQFSVRRTIFP